MNIFDDTLGPAPDLATRGYTWGREGRCIDTRKGRCMNIFDDTLCPAPDSATRGYGREGRCIDTFDDSHGSAPESATRSFPPYPPAAENPKMQSVCRNGTTCDRYDRRLTGVTTLTDGRSKWPERVRMGRVKRP